MVDPTEKKVQNIDYLGMSDEELLNAPPPTEIVAPEEEEQGALVSNDEEEEVDGNEETDEGQTPTEAESKGLLEVKDDGKESETDQAEGKTESNPEPKVSESKPEVKKEESTEAVFDYKAAYEKLTTPFKANGRDIAVKNVDDAIALMQMGANYNKKMAALKPNLKLMKMLENNGLLNEERIGFLIDLEKKNPEAISKLVKDSGLDPLDLDADKAGTYKPNTYKVDDREMELDTVLDELQGTPTYNQTLNIVSNLWDGPSKQVIANSPQLLKIINSHVQSGIYDLISKEVESERVFGRLNGLSDIEAYRQVGDAIQARGGFNHLAQQPKETTSQPVIVQPKPKSGDDDKLREKKRAAGITQARGASTAAMDFNPLSMSDEEFSKVAAARY